MAIHDAHQVVSLHTETMLWALGFGPQAYQASGSSVHVLNYIVRISDKLKISSPIGKAPQDTRLLRLLSVLT